MFKGDVDLTGLYDEIKTLKMKNEELTAEIEKMRLLGAVQEHDNVLRSSSKKIKTFSSLSPAFIFSETS